MNKKIGAVLVGGMSLLGSLPVSEVAAQDRPVIEVQVEVTEVDHNKASRLGIQWLDRVQVLEQNPAGLVALGSVNRITPFQADLNLMIQEGAAELLAHPNLVTDAGTTATFQVGGEIPYVTTSSLGNANVEFKPYGVLLRVKPDVTENGLIEMTLQASVSAPDQTNGVVLSGNTVPALLEREVRSHVTVRPGTTMTLAGLVQTVKEETTKGVPFLRRIPLLNSLFQWKKEDVRRTSVVMFVTPNLL